VTELLASSRARRARFIVLSDGSAPSSTRESNDSGRRSLVWRVVAANNRPLGRSVGAFADFADCLAAATELHEQSEQARAAIAFDRGSVSWRWTVSLGVSPVAVSVRDYSRRIECERALSQFLEIVSSEPPVIDEVRYAVTGSRA
jgi:hypothetical protein